MRSGPGTNLLGCALSSRIQILAQWLFNHEGPMRRWLVINLQSLCRSYELIECVG